ncbi:MAG: 1-acyl-sn-glycerol-3-phosphate acyltransferase [Bacteroidaceae bacterium]|nr:1-acyl-sn-glycerol-3-phosphate acyltransferase [Bacteroidaceae bacterium]
MEQEFDSIRPYEDGEMKQALNDLLGDRQFQKILQGFIPWLPKSLRNGLLRLAFVGINTPFQFQKRFMRPVMNRLIKKATKGLTFGYEAIERGSARYTFVSNHRDIVLDSALLDMQLFQHKFEETVEIAIGDNLLIYPWIKTLVRMNKAFTVRRGLSPRELLQSSQLMSRYMHHAINEKKDFIWIAQREGRAKDSSDHTQESVLKMLAMGGEGTTIERLKGLHIVPLTISYEYDPCDYLKAKEFQQKRDDPKFKKSKQDDLTNMKIGIFGQKGRVHYQAAPCIDEWLDELADTPRTEVFGEIARRMDQAIHAGYRLFPGNYVACDLLSGTAEFADRYTAAEKATFEAYLQSRIDLIDLPNKDVPFLRESILTMYANPVRNHLLAVSQPSADR